MAERSQRLLCLICAAETVATAGERLTGCPGCGSNAVPADLDNTATITLSVHELRVLTMWAAAWGRHIGHPQPVPIICDRLTQQVAAALSFEQEVADVRAALPDADVTVYRDGRVTDI